MKTGKNQKCNNGGLTILVFVLVTISILGIFVSAFGSLFGKTPDSDIPAYKDNSNVLQNSNYIIDSNITLVQNSYGRTYAKITDTELIENRFAVYVTHGSSGDYISVDFNDVFMKDFLESNHTQLKISFDMVGVEGYSMPIMNISPVYYGLDSTLDVANVKISSSGSEKISCVSSAKSSSASLLGNFDVVERHTFEYVFVKNLDGTLSVRVVFDSVSDTGVYSVDISDMKLSSVEIMLSPDSDYISAVRVENLSVGYVPTLTAFPGEIIEIPVDVSTTVIGDKSNPIYNICNQGQQGSLNSDKNTITVEDGIPGGAYASIYLADDYKSINVFDYDYLTIEYEVNTLEGVTPVQCMAYLLGRPVGVKQYVQSNTWFYVDETEIYSLNQEKTHMSSPSDTIHVKYIISGDKLQVFFNDVLYYDASEVFDSTYNCIEELRIKHFSGVGSLQFTNLKVYGYTVNE